MLRFISDLHFGHKNCMAYDARPYKTIEEHDEALIEKWNSIVDVNDDVWILGDISWHGAMKTVEILNRLNGIKHLCAGNHDKKLLRCKEFRDCFVEITDYREIQIDDHFGIVLSHYPIPCFNMHYYGWIHLYGHVHTSFEYNMMERVKFEMENLYDKPCRMYNVGAMIPYMEYAPRTLEEILVRNS